MSKPKVLVAMSGGIDSSIAAMLLHEQGYEVIGITMKVWDYASAGGSTKETGCCSLDSINDARDMAVTHGFPHYILDLRDEFSFIITNFVDEYIAGHTPNPCVLCNTYIKWEALLKRADQLNCEFIATGHYAHIEEQNGRYFVAKGVDETKDQSYVLWGLSQESLRRTMLPLGKYHKSEIKQMAKERGFPELAAKSESYEICFIPDNDYRNFLKKKVEGLAEKLNGGEFVNTKGEVLGKHLGYPFYTIGQRKGLNFAAGHPMYVVAIDVKNNRIVLGEREDLNRKTMLVKDFVLSKYAQIPAEGLEVLTKIRYKDKGTMSRIMLENDVLKVEFYGNVSAIAAGQSAVFYEDNHVVGGGVIAG